jgi:hypothetical protein
VEDFLKSIFLVNSNQRKTINLKSTKKIGQTKEMVVGGVGDEQRLITLAVEPEPRPNRAFKLKWPKRPFGPLKPWPGLLN